MAHDEVILTDPAAAPHPGVGDTYLGGVDTLTTMSTYPTGHPPTGAHR